MADKRFFTNSGPISLSKVIDLALILNQITGDLDQYPVDDVNSLEKAGPNEISFLDNSKYFDEFLKTKAGYCFINNKYLDKVPEKTIPLICDNPYREFAKISAFLYENNPVISDSISKEYIDPSADIPAGSIIDPGVFIGPNVKIGTNVKICSNSSIGKGVVIGNNCRIDSNVTLSHCLIGDDVEILPGVRIGQAGFGFVPDPNGHIKIPQLGRVIIGNDVQIGSNTAIDRGSASDTVIGNGCRIDNLVHIAHNVILGKGCIVAGQVGIAGSTRIGDYVMFAGQVGISGHLEIGSGSQFAVKAGVIHNVPVNSVYGGFPAVTIRDWHRQTIAMKSLTNKKGFLENE